MNATLDVRDITVRLAGAERPPLVQNVSFSLPPNSCLGILGESGSGKTMLCRAFLGLLDSRFTVSGQALFQGRDLLRADAGELRRLRGSKCCMILQNPMTAFDPLWRIGAQMTETFRSHRQLTERQAGALALDVLRRMRLREPEEALKKYPHQLSGGMLQRVMIGIALALEPDLIIADEPTTALDAVTQYEVMEEFVRIRERLQTAMIFISHDFGVISRIADRILVMNQGQVEEEGTKAEIFCQAQQPYTRYLIGTRAALMAKYREAVYGESGKELIACAVQAE
ncbi:MAG: ABC transporter ATP-binding protein [Sporomusaceae bacterium]|nr:ABC transporter ATP-binding protein [Sporomusaceae bacterium]